MTAVRLAGVARRYDSTSGAVDALRGIDLSIDSGEAVAIVGPSGCGKSTLLGLIAGLERPTAGTVVVGTVDLATLDDAAASSFRRTTVGLVFQSTDLMPFLTARENVDLALALNGRADDGAARRLLEQLDLGAHVEKMPDQLSGGQRQRVGIARAIAHRPALVLADEPTGALDSGSGEQVMALLDDLNQRGQTILLVTHDAKLAAAHGRRIVTLRDGRVEDDARIEPRRTSEPRELVRLGAEEA